MESRVPELEPRKVREQHVELIRRAVLGAARRLFGKLGYPRTPIRLLAQEAGVAVQTVYATFGSKAGVLVALLDFAGEDPAVEATRAEIATITDPRDLAAAVARLHRQLYERHGDVAFMLRDGAAGDRDVASVHAELRARGWRAVRSMSERLAAAELLGGRDPEAVAVQIQALLLPDVFELARARGWSLDRYEEWLRDALETVLERGQRR